MSRSQHGLFALGLFCAVAVFWSIDGRIDRLEHAEHADREALKYASAAIRSQQQVIERLQHRQEQGDDDAVTPQTLRSL